MSIRVMPAGPKDAKVALIGEAPGAVEAAQGEPFVGMAGNLLNEVMQLAMLVKRMSYIDNVVPVQPLNNDIGHYIEFKRGGVYTTPEYDAYEQELYKRLEGVKANVIVAIGGVALYALTRKQGITKWRGSILESAIPSWHTQRKVIPIIHPAAALRQYTLRHIIVMDLRRVRDEMEDPRIKIPSRIMRIDPSFEDSIEYIHTVMKEHKECGFDIEVINKELSCFAVSKSPIDIMCINLVRGGHAKYTEEHEAEVVKALGMLLEDRDVVKIGQNIIFDTGFMLRKYGIKAHRMEDTMIAMGVLYPELPKGLDFITAMCTKEPYYKDEGKQYIKQQFDDEAFWIYNAKDAAVCHEAFPRLMSALEEQGNTAAYELQRDIIPPLVYMQERGMKVNIEGLKQAREDADKRITELTQEFNKMTGGGINVNSPKQLMAYFYITKGVKSYVKRGTGKPTIDEDALKRLSRRGFKEAEVVLELRGLTKLKGTYLDVELEEA